MRPHEVIETLERLVGTCAKCLSEHPEDVVVETKISTKTIVTYIKVNQADCGKVIGKRGRTIDCIYHLASNVKNLYLANDNRSYRVEVIETNNDDFHWNNKKDDEGE